MGLKDWKNVKFVDESKFCLIGSDRIRRISRKPGKDLKKIIFEQQLSIVEVCHSKNKIIICQYPNFS